MIRLSEACAAAKGNIRVICRVRPLPSASTSTSTSTSISPDKSCVSFPLDPTAVVLSLPDGCDKTLDKIFHFSSVLKENSSQADCYDETRAAGDITCHTELHILHVKFSRARVDTVDASGKRDRGVQCLHHGVRPGAECRFCIAFMRRFSSRLFHFHVSSSRLFSSLTV